MSDTGKFNWYNYGWIQWQYNLSLKFIVDRTIKPSGLYSGEKKTLFGVNDEADPALAAVQSAIDMCTEMDEMKPYLCKYYYFFTLECNHECNSQTMIRSANKKNTTYFLLKHTLPFYYRWKISTFFKMRYVNIN